MIKVETSTVIDRPIEEVFEFTVSSENDTLWQIGVISTEETSEGPVEAGSPFTQVVQVLGRKLEIPFEVTKYEPNQIFGFKSTGGPVPVEGEFRYQTVPEGTAFSMFLEGEPGGFFKLAEPLVARSIQRQWETNLANLKDLLETRT